MNHQKFVLLDRDGVINEDSEYFIKTPDEWLPIPGSLKAISDLFHGGYKIVVITNQSGLARGLLDREMLAAIHRKMHAEVAQHQARIEAVYFCPHGPADQCDCRKPRPGLLRRFAHDYRSSLAEVPFIGDSYRDIEAGFAAGASPFLVKTGKGMATLAAHPEINVPVFENLYDAAQYLLSRQ